jgi:uncharacterized membrane protein YqjE
MAQGPAANLLASLKRVVGTLVAIAETRLELLVVEFEEERARVGVLLLYAALAMLCLALGIILLTFLIVVLFWDSYRIQSVSGLAVFFLIAGGVLWRVMSAKAREKPRLFAASLSELHRDREQLHGEHEEQA